MCLHDVIVIGGGASGLVAAISAAKLGNKVMIMEKTDRIGRKILATGNGRCNLSNINSNDYEYNSDNMDFPSAVIARFNVDETLRFFNELGVLHKIESEGRVYPFSDQAASVLEVLRMEIDRLKIEISYESPVIRIENKNNLFHIYTASKSVSAQKVIIACGGLAGPQYGTDGSGYNIARDFGHSIITPNPALVQVVSNVWYNKRFKGVRVKGQASLTCNGDIIKKAEGEIQFNEDGISGICVFDISRELNTYLSQGKKCNINIDMFPEYTEDDIFQLLKKRKDLSKDKTTEEFLIGMINKKLIPVILKLSGVNDINLDVSYLSSNQLDKIAKQLKNWEIPAISTRSWEHAQVTAGGVDTKEINKDTLESIITSGLYFAGEIMDVDGKCGGYNLQWAWSSGFIAGQSAAMKLRTEN